jgi:cell volume regulation protein A
VEDKAVKPSDYPLEKELIDQVKKDLMEVKITPDCRAAGKSTVSLNLPKTALIVMIKREDHFLTPRGDTVLKPGDRLWVLAEDKSEVSKVLSSIGVPSGQKVRIDTTHEESDEVAGGNE